MKNLTAKVSVIIPIYNVEKYIERCCYSVCEQTYKNLEIILVNDGSTDKSGIIIKNIAENDNRIIIVNKKNGGLSDARNKGMDISTGEYIMFVDGDDYLENDTIEKLICRFDDEIDIVVFPYIREYPNRSIVTEIFDEDEITFDNEDVKNCLLPMLIGPFDKNKIDPFIMNRLNTAWGKLYKKTAINKFRFVPTSEIGVEDGWFNIQVFGSLKNKVVYTNSCSYHYEKSNTSSLLHTYRKEFGKKRWNMYTMLINYMQQENIYNSLEKNLANRIVAELIELVINISNASSSCASQIKELKHFMREYNYKQWFSKSSIRSFRLDAKVFLKQMQYGFYGLTIIELNLLKKIKK